MTLFLVHYCVTFSWGFSHKARQYWSNQPRIHKQISAQNYFNPVVRNIEDIIFLKFVRAAAYNTKEQTYSVKESSMDQIKAALCVFFCVKKKQPFCRFKIFTQGKIPLKLSFSLQILTLKYSKLQQSNYSSITQQFFK
jgi:hypothetical protein